MVFFFDSAFRLVSRIVAQSNIKASRVIILHSLDLS